MSGFVRHPLKHSTSVFFVLLLLLCSFGSHLTASDPFLLEHPDPKPSSFSPYSLDSIFPVDDILQIKVSNLYGVYVLKDQELIKLKKELKNAKYAGCFFAKPRHVFIELQLKKGSAASVNYILCSTGEVHFDNGISRFGKKFQGTFNLPSMVNFDTYK
jgi:hypothetical protein